MKTQVNTTSIEKSLLQMRGYTIAQLAEIRTHDATRGTITIRDTHIRRYVATPVQAQ